MLEVKAKDQRHNAHVFSKKKRKDLRLKNRKFSRKFRRSPKKKGFCKVSARFLACSKTKNKIVMTLARFQQIKNECCPRAEDNALSRTCRLRSQGQELDLCGQGLQIVYSRTPPLVGVLSKSDQDRLNNIHFSSSRIT